MSIEEHLRTQLAEVADGLARPDASVPGLERAGRHERTRRRTTLVGVGAAAAVLVVIAGVSIPKLAGDAVPQPTTPTAPTSPATPQQPGSLDDLPVGDASKVPWWQGGVLHAGDTAVDTPLREIRYAGGTTIVGRPDFEAGSEWFLLAGDRLTPLVSSGGLLEPVISADGRTIAWSDPVADTTRRLVAYDVASRSEVGSMDVTVHPTCCDAGGEIFINGIDLDGRVVYSALGEPARIWTPGGADIEVSGVEGSLLDNEVWPGGVMWQGRGVSSFDLPGVYGAVDENGGVHRVGTVETDQLGTWSPDGTAYVYPGQADGTTMVKVGLTDVWVERIDTGERTRLLLPAERAFEIVAWETPTTVVLQTRNDFGEKPPEGESHGLAALVRCDTVTGVCERTGDGVPPNAELPPQR